MEKFATLLTTRQPRVPHDKQCAVKLVIDFEMIKIHLDKRRRDNVFHRDGAFGEHLGDIIFRIGFCVFCSRLFIVFFGK